MKGFLLFLILSGNICLAQNFWEPTNGPYDYWINKLCVSPDGDIFVATSPGRVFRSTDDGENWINVTNNLPGSVVFTLAINDSGDIFAGVGYTSKGVYRSTNNGASWVNKLDAFYVNSIEIGKNGNIYAGVSDGMYRSTDNGESWTYQANIVTSKNVIAIDSSGNIYVGNIFHLYRSTNEGVYWTEVTPPSGHDFLSIAVNSDNDLFAGASNGVFFSADSGNTWTQRNEGLINDTVRSLVIDSNNDIFAGTYKGACRSINNGTSWTPINGGWMIDTVQTLAINHEGYIFAGTWYGGVYRSIYPATYWIEVLTPDSAEVLEANTTKEITWASSDMDSVKIEYTIDSTSSWNTIVSVYPAGSGSYDWAVPSVEAQYCKIRISDSQNPLMFDISDEFFQIMIPSAVGNSDKNPESYSLEQNYPNPFNPNTTIEYTIAKKTKVNLKVYDLLGNEIAGLVNEVEEAGKHHVNVNLNNLTSGIYFYRIQAGPYTKTMKMILVK